MAWEQARVLIPFLAGLLFGHDGFHSRIFLRVLIPFLAGLLFGPKRDGGHGADSSLNPLFGGSASRTFFLSIGTMFFVLIPFLAGLLFGRGRLGHVADGRRLNPLFGGSAFRTRMSRAIVR